MVKLLLADGRVDVNQAEEVRVRGGGRARVEWAGRWEEGAVQGVACIMTKEGWCGCWGGGYGR